MKTFKDLRVELSEESFLDRFINLFRGDDKPLDRSRNVLVRAKDMKHETAGVTVMLKKHTDYRSGREAYDWTLKEPTSLKRYYGTLKKNSDGGWTAMGVGRNSQPVVETSNHGDSLKAIKKVYKSLSKTEGSTSLPYPLISRGNALSRPLTK